MGRPVVTDTRDEKQIAAAEAWAEQEAKGFEQVVKSKLGRRWLYDLIFSTCHYDQLSLVPGCGQSTAFNEGARSVGVALASRMRTEHPGMFEKMIEEND